MILPHPTLSLSDSALEKLIEFIKSLEDKPEVKPMEKDHE